MPTFNKDPSCLPECVGVSWHAALCPVAHTPEELEIALLKMAIIEAQKELAARRTKSAQAILAAAIGGKAHQQAVEAKDHTVSENFKQTEAEKHVQLRCVVCGRQGPSDEVALNAKGYARCVKGGCA